MLFFLCSYRRPPILSTTLRHVALRHTMSQIAARQRFADSAARQLSAGGLFGVARISSGGIVDGTEREYSVKAKVNLCAYHIAK